ncbi:ATP-binding protein [Corallococcus sicarius]|nr:ATP-binding protein [Corallococcus sicarius]
MRAGPAAREGPEHSRATPTVRPSPVELLLQVGSSLRAALIVDSDGRIVWMDPVLAGAAGWQSSPPFGRSAEEVLGGLPWLQHALDEALTGTDGLCEDGGQDQRLSAVVVPVFGEDGTQLGACARLRKSGLRPQALCPGAAEERRAQGHLETAERQALAEQGRLLAAEREAREQLEESFAVLDALLNHAPVALGFIGRDLRCLRINDALAALHGRSREEEIGKTVREMTPQLAPIVEPLMRRVLDEGTPIIGLDMTGEDSATPGEQRHWNVSYYPVRSSSGTILGLGAVVSEVTEEYRAQAERDRLLREAQEAIRVRDDFLSIAAHELKTPLTPLKLHLQMLKGQADAGHAVAPRHVDKALAQLARLSVLVNDLLDTSRIQAGKLELTTEPLPLREFIREVLADFRGTNSLHSLRFEAPDEPLVIRGDRARLAQVLGNLVENAFKYSPTGGTVRVTARRMGTEACVSVKDEGIGIPKEEQAHLFERFFRARNAPISGFGGLGLGLYICRDIIERHGGRIWVESGVEQGSTFHFALPCL